MATKDHVVAGIDVHWGSDGSRASVCFTADGMSPGELNAMLGSPAAPDTAAVHRRRRQTTDVSIGSDRGQPVVRLGAHLGFPSDDDGLSALTAALDRSVAHAEWARSEVEDLGMRSYVTLTLCVDGGDLDAAAAVGARAQQHFERTVAPVAAPPIVHSDQKAALQRSYLEAFTAVLADAD